MERCRSSSKIISSGFSRGDLKVADGSGMVPVPSFVRVKAETLSRRSSQINVGGSAVDSEDDDVAPASLVSPEEEYVRVC